MPINGEYTHNFHPYPAKFPYHAIRDLILNNTKEGDTILDPFCGSGTTLVECRLIGRNGIGIELNPVGCLISRAKSAYYTPRHISEIDHVYNELVPQTFNVAKWVSEYKGEALTNHPNKEYWFMPHVIREMYAIHQHIQNADMDDATKNLMLMAFSKIIVPVSNQDSETRYKAIKKTIAVGDALRLFLQTIADYKDKLVNSEGLANPNINVSVIEGDTHEEINKIKKCSIQYIITSPPYINSFDYYLYHKHRIFWLNKDPKIIRSREIGGHHSVDNQTYEEALKKYSDSMRLLLEECHKILKPSGTFTILIGDGIVRNKKIDVGKLMKNLAMDCGYTEVDINSTGLRNVSSMFIKGKNIDRKNHHVITLRK